jgi:hypothetical protein
MKKSKKPQHHWTKQDFILTFFVSKYGTSGLYLREDEVISHYIGTSVGSLKKMYSNFRHLLGKPNQLNHIKNLQQEVFDEYNNVSYGQYVTLVKNMINHDEISRQIMLEKMGKTNYRFVGKRGN